MSFVSDELANVLKSVYMMEGSVGKEEDRDSSKKADKSNGDVSKEKRSRKHKHKKHSKSKDKKKHKKRKHKSRSRTRSQSRSRSRSRSIERGESLKKSKNRSRSPSSRSKSPMTPDEIELDFVLEKEKPPDTVDGNCENSDKTENDLNGADGTVCLSKVASEEEPNHQVVCESKTPDDKGEERKSTCENASSEKGAEKEVGCFNTNLTLEKEEKDRSRSRSQSVGKVTDSKNEKSPSHSRSRSKSPDAKSCRRNKNRHSRSHSRDKKTKRNSRSPSSSKDSSRKKKSRSRSHSRKKSFNKRSKSRSKERRSKRSLSKSRSRSHSYSSRSRSRSPRRSRSRSVRCRKSRSRSRRKSPAFRNFRRFSPRWKKGVNSFRRRWSRSRSRSRRSRSSRRSSSRRRQSRSRSRGRRSRSRSRSRLRSRRSRSRSGRSRSTSRDRKRKRSRSKSRSYSRDRRRSRSKGSKSKDKEESSNTLPATSVTVTNKVSSLIDKPIASDLSTQQVKVAQRAGGKTIAELTAFCKKLQEEKEIVDSDGAGAAAKTEEDDSQPVAHHPFLVKETPDITIPPVIFPVNRPPAPTVDPSKPLQEQFPVSCGSKHRQKEDVSDGAIVADVDGSAIQSQPKEEVFAPPPAEKFDISELVAKRMDSQRRLQSDPNDIEALLTLQEIQMKMQNWCQSNVKPGQFTGELVKNLLPKENLQGGFQAWAKKDMFHNLTPVSGGIGMKLLQKMGWKPGQVIGKRGEGYAEPIALTVKIDRKGLSTGKEKATKKGAPAMLDLQGKHPVSALAEYCSKRKWQLPDYSLVFDHGPAHHKQFLFKVLVNSVEYQPAVVCGNKKQAKAQAAIYALKGLGLIPEDADISAV